MFALIVGAVRARTAQVVAVLVLTALASAVAAAGPWFVAAGEGRAAAADVASAPASQRMVSASVVVDTGGEPAKAMDQFAETVQAALPLPGVRPVQGLSVAVRLNRGASALAYRDGFCERSRLDGRCPSAAGEAAVSPGLGLVPGDRLTVRASPTTDPITVTVVGRYTTDDPAFRARGGSLDPIFTPVATFALSQLSQPTISYDMPLPDALIRGDGGYDLAAVLQLGKSRLDAGRLRLVTSVGGVLDTIARDRATIRRGVLVSMLQMSFLTWFAIGLAGRYTGRDRRGDAALLKLRGSTRLGMLRLAWGQHLVPLVLGTLAGAPLGYFLARVLCGPVTDPAARHTATVLSPVAAGVVLLGGLAGLAVVEALVLRLPVAALLRQAGSARGDWRAGMVDVLLLAVAASAVYQVWSGGSQEGLALAAPAMVALAVALVLARLLGRVADLGGGAAVRAGRLRLGLTAVQVSRQPGSERVFALVVVSVALFGLTLGGWQAERTARVERSAAELGASRVLTVEAANRTALLDAVRRADPGGREAMAAVVDRSGAPPVLAVDSSRLAAVARWRPEYGPPNALPVAAFTPLPSVTGDRLGVRLRHDGAGPVVLTLVLQNDVTGIPVRVSFGTLRAGEQTASAPVAGCAPGCRILRWELTPSRVGTTVTVRGLDQHHPEAAILDPARLGDITRWRSGTGDTALQVAAARGALRMSTGDRPGGFQVYAVETGLPLPIALAGPAPADWQFNDPTVTVFGGGPVPVRPVASTEALPVLGRQGILVDLDAARRLAADASPPGQFQVWLADGTGRGIVERLTAAGLTVTGDDSVAARSGGLADQGPSTVARFALLTGVAGLLLAAATLAVAAAVDRRSRLEQLRVLRAQGLSGRTALGIGYLGTVALIGAGLLGGVVAAALAHQLAAARLLPFTDGWQVLPPPGSLSPAALATAALLALVTLGLTGWLSLRPLIRGLRGGAR